MYVSMNAKTYNQRDSYIGYILGESNLNIIAAKFVFDWLFLTCFSCC